jgi:hypothetical protein
VVGRHGVETCVMMFMLMLDVSMVRMSIVMMV